MKHLKKLLVAFTTMLPFFSYGAAKEVESSSTQSQISERVSDIRGSVKDGTLKSKSSDVYQDLIASSKRKDTTDGSAPWDNWDNWENWNTWDNWMNWETWDNWMNWDTWDNWDDWSNWSNA